MADEDEVCGVQCVVDPDYQMEWGMETVGEQGLFLGQMGDGEDVFCDDLDEEIEYHKKMVVEQEHGLGLVGGEDEVCGVQFVDYLDYLMEWGMETVAEQVPFLGQMGDEVDVFCDDLDEENECHKKVVVEQEQGLGQVGDKDDGGGNYWPQQQKLPKNSFGVRLAPKL